jgi:pimeloyl-ACP methyl ester carboxylesterase
MSGTVFIERTVKLSFGDVPYLEGGEGPALFFLHGAFAMPHAYEPFLNLLSKYYRVIAPTHPGHGLSFKVDEKWRYFDYLETYKELLQVINITPAVLMGHSFGGCLALSLALTYPEVPVIALDPVGLPFKTDISDFLRGLVNEGEEALRVRPNLTTMAELVAAAKVLLITITKHPENIPWFYQHGPTLDITADLCKLNNPVSIFWGENDLIVPLEVGQKMGKLLRHVIFTSFPGLQHDYAVTHPEFTYTESLKVLKQLKLLEK